MFYSIAKAIMKFLLFFVFRIRTRGKENIPAEGGAIFAYNHRSNRDPVIAAVTSTRKLHFMAKEELFKNPLFGGLIKSLGAFPVKRGKSDIGAVKSAMKILGGGDVMLMFPEGHRIKDGRIVKAKPGVALIAHMAKAPVVPVNISGKYRWMHKITVTYGEPVYLNLGKKPDQAELQAAADGILNSVRALDPKLTERRNEN